jgi:hypothetical protein
MPEIGVFIDRIHFKSHPLFNDEQVCRPACFTVSAGQDNAADAFADRCRRSPRGLSRCTSRWCASMPPLGRSSWRSASPCTVRALTLCAGK